jgi:hypothetical protein
MLTIKCMTEHEVCEDWSGDGGWDERRQRGKWPCIRVGRDVTDERISRLYLHISCNPFLTCLYITIPTNGIMADYSWFDREDFLFPLLATTNVVM